MKLAAMYKTVYFFLIAVLLLLVNACDNNNDFADIEEAIRLNKLNITSIEVEASLAKTVEVDGQLCNTQNICNTFLPTEKKVEPFKAYGFSPDNKKTDITSEVVWSTSNSTIATITHDGNLTTQNAEGDVDVIATLGSVVGKTTVTVNKATVNGSDISFQNNGSNISGTPTITACETYPLTILGLFSDGSLRDITHDVTWKVTLSGVDTQGPSVDENGVFSSYAVSPQSPTATPYTITVSYTDKINAAIVSSQDINVNDTNGTMSVDPATFTIPSNKTKQLSAKLTIGNVSKDVTSIANWTSDKESLATVTSGLVNGVAIGNDITITATCGSKSTTATATVADQLDVARLSLKYVADNSDVQDSVDLIFNDTNNDTVDLNIIATYVDNTTADVTADFDNSTIYTISFRSLDPNDTSIAVSKSFVTDALGGTNLRLTAARVGTASMHLVYKGIGFYQYIDVQ